MCAPVCNSATAQRRMNRFLRLHSLMITAALNNTHPDTRRTGAVHFSAIEGHCRILKHLAAPRGNAVVRHVDRAIPVDDERGRAVESAHDDGTRAVRRNPNHIAGSGKEHGPRRVLQHVQTAVGAEVEIEDCLETDGKDDRACG